MLTQPLPSYDAEPSAAEPTLSGPEPLLVLRHAQAPAQRTPLPAGGQVILGRGQNCGLRLLHPSVSRTHARVWNEDGEVWIEDLGTVHGTCLDGLRIDAPARLKDGMEIELGRCLGDGWSLQFEDPALALVRELGLLERSEEAEELEGPEADADDPSARPSAEPNEDSEESGEEFETALATRAEAAIEGQIESRSSGAMRPIRSLARRPLLWLAVAVFLATGALVAWAAQVVQPSALGWRWVQMTPAEIASGVVLGLESPDIRPDADLVVYLGGVEVAARTVPGRMEIEIPALDGEALNAGRLFDVAGRHDVELQIHLSNGREVLRTTLPYVVRPRVEHVQPMVADEGDVVEIVGQHLAAGPATTDPAAAASVSPPVVRVGGVAAEVLDAQPKRLRVRVPELGRERAPRQPLEVVVGTSTGRAPELLEIRVPAPVPDPSFFRLEHGSGTWWLRPAVGPPLAYASKQAAQHAVATWDEVLDDAAEDPTITLDVVPTDGVYLLRAVGGTFVAPRVLGRFGVPELRATTGEADIEPSLLAYWLATAWNPLVDAAARGIVPGVEPATGLSPAYGAALGNLVRGRDQAALHHDRPHRHLVGQLAPLAERELAQVLRAFPRHLAEVAGSWSARLENVFLPGEGYSCLVDLDLHRFEETLGGTARLRFVKEEAGIEFSLPEVHLTGELRPGPEPRLVLQADFNRPVGELELQARFAGGRLEGVYAGPVVGGGQARWKAERRAETVTDW